MIGRKFKVKLYKVRSIADIKKMSKKDLETELFLVESKLQLLSAKIYILNMILEDVMKAKKVIK